MIHSITFYFLCSSPLSLTECLTSTEEHLCCQAVIHISFSKHRPDKNNNNKKKPTNKNFNSTFYCQGKCDLSYFNQNLQLNPSLCEISCTNLTGDTLLHATWLITHFKAGVLKAISVEKGTKVFFNPVSLQALSCMVITFTTSRNQRASSVRIRNNTFSIVLSVRDC